MHFINLLTAATFYSKVFDFNKKNKRLSIFLFALIQSIYSGDEPKIEEIQNELTPDHSTLLPVLLKEKKSSSKIKHEEIKKENFKFKAQNIKLTKQKNTKCSNRKFLKRFCVDSNTSSKKREFNDLNLKPGTIHEEELEKINDLSVLQACDTENPLVLDDTKLLEKESSIDPNISTMTRYQGLQDPGESNTDTSLDSAGSKATTAKTSKDTSTSTATKKECFQDSKRSNSDNSFVLEGTETSFSESLPIQNSDSQILKTNAIQDSDNKDLGTLSNSDEIKTPNTESLSYMDQPEPLELNFLVDSKDSSEDILFNCNEYRKMNKEVLLKSISNSQIPNISSGLKKGPTKTDEEISSDLDGFKESKMKSPPKQSIDFQIPNTDDLEGLREPITDKLSDLDGSEESKIKSSPKQSIDSQIPNTDNLVGLREPSTDKSSNSGGSQESEIKPLPKQSSNCQIPNTANYEGSREPSTDRLSNLDGSEESEIKTSPKQDIDSQIPDTANLEGLREPSTDKLSNLDGSEESEIKSSPKQDIDSKIPETLSKSLQNIPNESSESEKSDLEGSEKPTKDTQISNENLPVSQATETRSESSSGLSYFLIIVFFVFIAVVGVAISVFFAMKR